MPRSSASSSAARPLPFGSANETWFGPSVVPHGLDVAVGRVLPVVVAVDRAVGEPRPRRAQRRRAVAVVQVEVEHGDALDAARRAQRFGRDDESVEGAEPLAVIGVRVMEAARERGGDAVVECARRRGERAAVGQQHRRPQRRRPRKLLRLGERARLAGAHGLDVRGRVNAEQVARSRSAPAPRPARPARPASASATSWNFRIGITWSPSGAAKPGS